MENIKVLHIITRFDKGGSAQNTYLSLLGLRKKNYQLSLVSGLSLESEMKYEEIKAKEKDIQILKSEGIEFIQCSSLLRRINIIKDLKAFFDIWRIIKKYNPLIVHTHSSKAGLMGRLAAKLAGTPIIVHTPHGHVFFGYFGPFKTKLFIIFEKLASRITDKVVALTNREKEDHILFKIAEEDKFSVIYSGIELNALKESSSGEKQNLKKELGIPENSLIVGTAGRLVPVKGPEFLVKASKYIISKYPDTYFMFTGDGTLEHDLKRKALEMGISDNIIFLGWRDDLAKIISIYDIFVLPSLNEGMGRVLVEAMALGKSIVASNIGGIPDLVIHGKNGFLVPPKNPKELAKYIQILLEDEKKREKMGLAGKEMSLNFSAENMVEKIAELYEELLIRKKISF
ncbi:MAG TPA: glycosyltransferase family 1 protein [Candidatus Aminicenantes bacterium]|nr:glycosyltransferase family 1 protein [Candidatus Aminicenantes bacterium]